MNTHLICFLFTSFGRSPAGPGNFLLGLLGVDPGVALPLDPTGVVSLSLTGVTATDVCFPCTKSEATEVGFEVNGAGLPLSKPVIILVQDKVGSTAAVETPVECKLQAINASSVDRFISNLRDVWFHHLPLHLYELVYCMIHFQKVTVIRCVNKTLENPRQQDLLPL